MKRFTETNKWSDPWFLDLPVEHKVIWLYLCDSCDIAGFWPVSLRMLTYCTGATPEQWDSFIHRAGDRRLRLIDCYGQLKAWLVKFILFQFPKGLHPRDPVRIAIQRAIMQAPTQDLTRGLEGPTLLLISNILEGATKDLPRGYHAPPEKEPEQEKEKEQVQGSGSRGGTGEIPSLEQAITSVMVVGIPADFCEYVYADWSTRNGCDGNGVRVEWVGYAAKRWQRERQQWADGSHRGNAREKGMDGRGRKENLKIKTIP